MRRDRWSRLVGMVGAGLLGLALLGGMVTRAGAHEGNSDPNAIHACVATRDGNVRIVGLTGSCNATKETAAHWSMQGPQGPTGAQGPSGVLGYLDDLEGLPCTLPGGGTGSAMLLVIRGQVGATLACGTGRFADLGPVVFDTQTRLMWEKKVTEGGGLHRVYDNYTWCEATGIATGCSVSPPSWIDQVNAEKFFAYSDWRVPTKDELATILLAACPGGGTPCIDPIFGPTMPNGIPTADSWYWSVTEDGPNNAYFVDFRNGIVDNSTSKLTLLFVRAVRGPVSPW